MSIADDLTGEVIQYVRLHGEKTGEATYSATVEEVRLGTKPNADPAEWAALVERFAGNRLVVEDDRIVVHELSQREDGKIEVAHPACAGKGCSDCWQGRLFYRCADPGEVDQ